MKSLGLLLLLFKIAWALSDGRLLVSISPPGKTLTYKENEDLNLTCKISGHELTGVMYNLSWNLPVETSPERVTVNKAFSRLTVIIHGVQESDSGQYVCEVIGGGIVRRRKVAVLVKSGNGKCLKHFFNCGNGLCIPQHYVCDGHVDCPGGNDEAVRYCGPNPCLGKFLCDGRCIPRRLCCDPAVDTNCSVNYIMPCCQRLLPAVVDVDVEPSSLSVLQPQYNEMYFFQCTVYTIISFAIAFILITTVLAIIICRFHSRHSSSVPHRTSQTHSLTSRQRLWPWHPSHHADTSTPLRPTSASLWNTDELISSYHRGSTSQLNDTGVISCQDPMEDFVLLTYGSHGFEIAECVPKPPPYTEAVQGIGQPPPPYASFKSLVEESEERLLSGEGPPEDVQGREG